MDLSYTHWVQLWLTPQQFCYHHFLFRKLTFSNESQLAVIELRGVKPVKPSSFPTVLALTILPNIHTNTLNSSLSQFAPLAPSHQLRSKVTPCHKKSSYAFSVAVLNPMAATRRVCEPMASPPVLVEPGCVLTGAGTGLSLATVFFFFITHLSLSPLLPPSAFSYTLTPKGNTPNVCLLSRMQADAGERQRLVVFFLTTADEGFLSRRTTVPHQTVSLCLSVFAASCRECHFPKGKRKQKKTGHINRNDQLCDPTDLKTWAMRTQTKAFDCKHDPAQPSPQRSCQYWPTTLIRLSCHLRTEISQGC